MNNAITKLKSEMDANENNSYIQVEKIMAADKTIAKSLDAMKKEAEKKKVGNCAVLTNQEGFEVVLKYFGIDTKPAPTVIKPVQIVSKVDDFDIKLDDLL